MSILDALKQCELFHLMPKKEMSRVELENLFDVEFYEIGASGKFHDRESCIETVLARATNEERFFNFEMSDINCSVICRNCYLLTYTLVQKDNNRYTKRATIWRYIDDQWKIIYHQGTVITEK